MVAWTLKRQLVMSEEGSSNKKQRPYSNTKKEALVVIRMAIIARHYPADSMSVEDFVALQAVLWDRLRAHPDPLPIIVLGNIIAGILHVQCEDQRSASWLIAQDGMTINGILYRVIDAKDLPKPVKMVWKTRNGGKLELASVLKVIQRIHPTVHSKRWRVVKTVSEGISARRIVLMDRVSADYIAGRGYTLTTGLDRSYFKLLAKCRAKGQSDSKQTESGPQPHHSLVPALQLADIGEDDQKAAESVRGLAPGHSESGKENLEDAEPSGEKVTSLPLTLISEMTEEILGKTAFLDESTTFTLNDLLVEDH